MIYPVPKPEPKQAKPRKPRKPIQRTRVRKVRSRARPGRLKGEGILVLREACFERDRGICVRCGIPLRLERGHWNSMEMAHLRGKRNWGDSLDNVRALCGPWANGCHRTEHIFGKTLTKPVPPKDSKGTEGITGRYE